MTSGQIVGGAIEEPSGLVTAARASVCGASHRKPPPAPTPALRAPGQSFSELQPRGPRRSAPARSNGATSFAGDSCLRRPAFSPRRPLQPTTPPVTKSLYTSYMRRQPCRGLIADWEQVCIKHLSALNKQGAAITPPSPPPPRPQPGCMRRQLLTCAGKTALPHAQKRAFFCASRWLMSRLLTLAAMMKSASVRPPAQVVTAITFWQRDAGVLVCC